MLHVFIMSCMVCTVIQSSSCQRLGTIPTSVTSSFKTSTCFITRRAAAAEAVEWLGWAELLRDWALPPLT